MEIIIQSLEIHIGDNLKKRIIRKLKSVCKAYSRISSCNVLLQNKKNNEQQHHFIEVKLGVPGETLFTKQKGETFEVALSKAAIAIKHQLEKHKEKFEKV